MGLLQVDTLLKLRDQIVQQRKWRIKQAAVVKGRPQNIRHMTPGPAQSARGCADGSRGSQVRRNIETATMLQRVVFAAPHLSQTDE